VLADSDVSVKNPDTLFGRDLSLQKILVIINGLWDGCGVGFPYNMLPP
jgi:hypothetical protein